MFKNNPASSMITGQNQPSRPNGFIYNKVDKEKKSSNKIIGWIGTGSQMHACDH